MHNNSNTAARLSPSFAYSNPAFGNRMKLSCSFCLLSFTSLLLTVTNAQEEVWQPTTGFPLKMSNNGVAKVYVNSSGKTVLGLITSGRSEKPAATIKTKSETRTRSIKDPKTGNENNESYVVEVPYAEAFMTFEGCPRRIEILLTDPKTKVWRNRGNMISQDEAILKGTETLFFHRQW